MGMYTGLRARVKIKPEFRAEITKLHEESGWENVKVPNIQRWLREHRNGFIPYMKSGLGTNQMIGVIIPQST